MPLPEEECPPLSSEMLEEYRVYLRALAQQQLSRRLRAKADVSDLVQQTLMAACIDLPNFRGQSEPELRSWLRRILSNKVAYVGRHWRSKKRNIAKEVCTEYQRNHSDSTMVREFAVVEDSPSKKLLREEKRDELSAALLTLLEDERTAVILKYYHQRSVTEIAVQIGRSREAVAGLLYRGLRKLRKKIDCVE